ncbi:MAG: hypothetical protein ACR2G6_14475 [Gemmatimonadaceae bacterium]
MIAEVIHEHAARVTVPNKGETYRVRTQGYARSDGMWEGWLEFQPVDRSGPVLRTNRETTQTDREALLYWATGLEPIYLEGAFARAT